MRSRRAGCLSALAVAVLVLVAVVLLRQPLGRLAANVALRVLARQLHGRIEYERLTGNVFTSPRFENILVVFGPDSVKARELAFSYDPFGFLRGRVPLSEVEIRSPAVFLSITPERLAAVREPAPGPAAYPKLSLRRLRIAEGAVFVNGRAEAESLELELGVSSTAREMRAQLVSASARLRAGRMQLRDMSAELRMTPESLLASGVTVRTRGSRLAGDVSLVLDGSGVAAVLENVNIDLSEFTNLPGRFRASGSAGIERGVRSGDLSCSAEGLVLGDVRLPRVSGRIRLAEPELQFEVAGRDPELGEFRLAGSADIHAQSFEGSVSLRRLRISRLDARLPNVRLDADVQVSGRGRDSAALVGTARVAELGVDSLCFAGVYDSGAVDVSRFEMRGPVGWVWMSGQWRTGSGDAGEATFNCVMESLDLGLVARFTGVEASGRLTGLVSGSGRPDTFTVKGGVRAQALTLAGVEFGKGLADFDLAVGRGLAGRLSVSAEQVKGAGLELETAQLLLDGPDFDLDVARRLDRLAASGSLALTRGGFRCDVGRFRFATREETLALAGRCRVEWSRDTLAVEDVRCDVAGGVLELDFAQVGRQSPSIALRGTSLNLRKLQKLFHLPVEVWGTLDFEVGGKDSFAVTVAGSDLELPAIDIVIKRLAADVRASREMMTVDRLWFVHSVDTTFLAGTVSYDLDGGPVLGEADLRAEIADPGVWLFGFMKPNLDLSSGQIYGQLALRGRLTDPGLSGRVRVVQGVLGIPGINATLDRVNAELGAGDGRVTLEKLSGGSGRGLVTASGFVDLGPGWLPDSARYRVRMDGATTNPLPGVYAVVDGDLALTWTEGQPFRVEGTIDVEEGLLAFGFGQAAPAGGGADSLVYEIRIRGERGIWLRNPLADIELAGDLTLRRTMTEETYSGQLSSRQGNIYYLDHTLTVTKGVIRFDNISRADPAVDITAELPVRVRLRTEGTAPDRVVLSLTGTLEKPEFQFASEPPVWDEGQIITYLNLNVTAEELAGLESREAAARYLSERLLGYFQTQATKRVRKYIGLDELRFESAFAGGEGYKVTVGKYVARDLYFTYTQNLTGQLQPAFTAEYYLSRKHEVVGAKSEDGRYSVRYRFRLRY